MNNRPIFRSSRAEIVVVGAVVLIGILCSWLLWKGYELNQKTERVAQATRIETQARTQANRAILRTLCQRQNYTYRVLRQDARGDIRTARVAVRQTLEFLRKGRTIPGVTRNDLIRSVNRAKSVVRQNRRFIRELEPANCQNFSDLPAATPKIPEGQEDFILRLNQDLERVKGEVEQIKRRLDRVGAAGSG